jgi:predicted ATPase/class 3 adenylate cyclase
MPVPTGTVSFLFTDIEGSTRLAREHPGKWESLQKRHHEILRDAFEQNNGYVFQVIGDAFCVAFHRTVDALNAAVTGQQALLNEDWGGLAVRVRMGIHTGEAEAQKNEYHGYLTLSLVQRLMSAGHGGQVLISGAAENLLRGQLPGDVELLDVGRHRFKDVPQPVRVFQVAAPGLRTEFPLLHTIDLHPNNLPPQLTSFVGRKKEIADVITLLARGRLVTLVGPGGTGKTRLSIQSAGEMMDNYPDGVWLVELAAIRDPLLVPRTTAIAIGLRDEPQRPVIDMLCDYLREKKMLILLDNCEHLVEACADMADRILHASPGIHILASSREGLGIAGEVTYQVPSMTLPDADHLPPVETLDRYEAIKLFIDRATASVPAFTLTDENAPALARICQRLDGIPLAIELAAAKIRVLSVDQIAGRLDDRFKLLTGGSRTALERHQTLRAAIGWSYHLLSPAEQVLFGRLSVFVDGWTLEAVESVCSAGPVRGEGVLDLLEQLIHKSLVTSEETQTEKQEPTGGPLRYPARGSLRYRMLETMRQYANEVLVESGESDALRDRHLEYFLGLAESAEPHLTRPEQLEWLARLDADTENLRAALEWSLGKESAEPSLRLCAALGRYWYLRGSCLEGRQWLDRTLAKRSRQTKKENQVRVKALIQDAALANWLDDLERMKVSAERCLEMAEQVSDRRQIAIARFYTGWACERQDEPERAISLFEQSLKEFQELQDAYWETVAYRWLAGIFVKRGDISAEEKIDHQLELARRAGERMELADALLNRARQHFWLSHFGEASRYVEEAQALFEEMSSSLNETLRVRAHLAWVKGNFKEARTALLELKDRYQISGDRNISLLAITDLGLLALEEGNLIEARNYLENALEMAQELGDQNYIAWRLAELGTIHLLEGRIEDCKQNYRESFKRAQKLVIFAREELLFIVIDILHNQKPKETARILGSIHGFVTETGRPIYPLVAGHSYDRAEARARQVLGDEAFTLAFAQGQKLSLDEALDLAQKTVEEL